MRVCVLHIKRKEMFSPSSSAADLLRASAERDPVRFH